MTSKNLVALLERCEDLIRDKSYYLQVWGTPTFYKLLGEVEAVTAAPADETPAGLCQHGYVRMHCSRCGEQV
jgi:hypothetical protein